MKLARLLPFLVAGSPACAGIIGGPNSLGLPGPEVDASLVPPQVVGAAVPRIRKSNAPLEVDTRGAFRTTCTLAHMNFDDVMVSPRVRGVYHLHMYAGNTLADAMADFEDGNIRNIGGSTCKGGTANRTAYWSPALIDTRYGRPVLPVSLGVYYKAGYDLPLGQQFVVPPVGLRMIAGSMHNTSPSGPFKFTCHGPGVNYTQQSIPNCPLGSLLVATIAFPQCWDGVRLDSADHKRHVVNPVAAKTGGRVCPDTHPMAIPKIELNWSFKVTESNAPLYWRFSSDHPGVPAGYSFHGDWWNGWDPDVIARWVNNCLNSPKDCHADLLGDGAELF